MASDIQDAANTPFAQAYRSEQLGALLEVFSLWSSGTFIRGLAIGAGVDLDATAIVAVTVLARDGEQRASVLASRLHVGASAISKLSGRLGSHGLIEKRPDPDDSRATLLRLTPEGTAATTALTQAGDAMMADLMRRWSDSDRADFNRLLHRFRDDAREHAIRVETRKLEPTTDQKAGTP
jgi:DNA-binding MarR family transcriptional regulator